MTLSFAIAVSYRGAVFEVAVMLRSTQDEVLSGLRGKIDIMRGSTDRQILQSYKERGTRLGKKPGLSACQKRPISVEYTAPLQIAAHSRAALYKLFDIHVHQM
jgi:hypothetical protein